MTIEILRELYAAEPFRPFVLHLADGRDIPVMNRELFTAAPSGQTAAIFQPDDSFNLIDLLLVTDVEIKPAENGSRKKRSR
jgi:hypothetical protein